MKISTDMVRIFLPHSKPDQLRQGQKMLIVRTNTATFPVAMLEHYMPAAEFAPGSELPYARAYIRQLVEKS